MLTIVKKVYDEILMHTRESYPIEACGYLAGNENIIKEIFKLTNVDNSNEHFAFAPQEQFEAYRKAREKGLKIIAVYHSHPYTPARMSEEDIRLAYDESLFYAIVSLAEKEPVLKFFKVANNLPLEVSYKII